MAVHAEWDPRTHAGPAATPIRAPTTRRYLMCPPTFFDVAYQINPWMSRDARVDPERALAQWSALRRTYLHLGHRVDLLPAVPGLPDLVYAANGALVVDGRALAVRFRHPQRQPESALYAAWLAGQGFAVIDPVAVNEGEGDALVVGDRILAGWGFRTSVEAHAEVATFSGRDVVSLELVDPRYYHLDTALTVLGPDHIAYLPDAFAPESRARLAELYPDAIRVTPADAEVLGLNAVSDGRHVVLAAQAAGFAEQLRAAGYLPIPLDLSELLKGGGGIKCCTLELRPAPGALA